MRCTKYATGLAFNSNFLAEQREKSCVPTLKVIPRYSIRVENIFAGFAEPAIAVTWALGSTWSTNAKMFYLNQIRTDTCCWKVEIFDSAGALICVRKTCSTATRPYHCHTDKPNEKLEIFFIQIFHSTTPPNAVAPFERLPHFANRSAKQSKARVHAKW